MKGKLCMALLLAALLCCLSAMAETYWKGSDFYHYRHLSKDCPLEDNLEPMEGSGANLHPCPACAPDKTKYPGIEACERGGTVVIRVPDRAVQALLEGNARPTDAPEALLHTLERQDDDLARLLHGNALLECLAMEPGESRAATALIPDLVPGKGDLLMSRRHLGAAWTFVLRPGKAARQALAKGGKLAITLRAYRVQLNVNRWPAGFTFTAGSAAFDQAEVQVKPKKSADRVTLNWKRSVTGDETITVYRDRDVNTCVVRVPEDKGQKAPRRWVRYGGTVTELRGYSDGKSGIYCLTVTDGEVDALREKRHFDIQYLPAAEERKPAPDGAPVTDASLGNGSKAGVAQAEYPVGTAFVAYRQVRPEGGIARYEADGCLERRSPEGWRWVAKTTALTGGDPERDFPGYFCDWVDLVVPLDRALEPGLYRLQVEGYEQGRTPAVWLEFRVREGAPEPALPRPREVAARADVADHTPAWAGPGYNSCLDNTAMATESRLRVGDTVFEALGPDLSWGWGIRSHYNLFCYPAGHRERAKLLRENIDINDLRLRDAGDGLLLWNPVEPILYHCGYDGSGLREIAKLEGDTGLDVLLPAGDGIYWPGKAGEIYRLDPDTAETERVFAGLGGAADKARFREIQYVDGTLLAACDQGIYAFDTAHPGADGLLSAKRLTESWDFDSADAGPGFLTLGGRLYCWSKEDGAMVSMDLDGGDRRVVSRTRYYFSQATAEGIVLALYGKSGDAFLGGYEGASFFFSDPDHPAFDPDHSPARAVAPEDYDFFFGDAMVHRANAYGDEDEEPTENWIPLAELRAD